MEIIDLFNFSEEKILSTLKHYNLTINNILDAKIKILLIYFRSLDPFWQNIVLNTNYLDNLKSATMIIFIQYHLAGRIFWTPIGVRPNDTIQDIINLYNIYNEIDRPRHTQLYLNNLLLDKNKTLKYYNIADNAVLRIELSM